MSSSEKLFIKTREALINEKRLSVSDKLSPEVSASHAALARPSACDALNTPQQTHHEKARIRATCTLVRTSKSPSLVGSKSRCSGRDFHVVPWCTDADCADIVSAVRSAAPAADQSDDVDSILSFSPSCGRLRTPSLYQLIGESIRRLRRHKFNPEVVRPSAARVPAALIELLIEDDPGPHYFWMGLRPQL
ncbi:hypothetical protein EVAR_32617_1 [Eumeta japonica]|uniref:Uncharacterized protein n=1 Tax=Eumeta variegata TaxID=151549 RepID=A0A4C1WIP4_EUMVA|nr:hypothetical protein EVAR_32617_1 [Eumeta japonica]